MTSQSLRAPGPPACLGRSSATPLSSLGGRLVGRPGWRNLAAAAAGEGPATGDTIGSRPSRRPPSTTGGASSDSGGDANHEHFPGSGNAVAVAACFAKAGIEIFEVENIMARNEFDQLQPWQLTEKLAVVKEVLRGVEHSKEVVLAKMCEAAARAARDCASNSEFLRNCHFIFELAHDLCPGYPPSQATAAVLAACDAQRLCLLASHGTRLSRVPTALEEQLGWSQQQAAAALLGLSARSTISPDGRSSYDISFHPVHSAFDSLLYTTPEHLTAVARALEARGVHGEQLAAATLAAASDWADPRRFERKRLVQPEAPDAMFWLQRGDAQPSYSAVELDSALQQLEAAGLPAHEAAKIWLAGGSGALSAPFVDIMRQMLSAGITAPELEELLRLSGGIYNQYLFPSLALLEALLSNCGGWHAVLQAVQADPSLLYVACHSPQPELERCRKLALVLRLDGDEELALAKALGSKSLEVSVDGLCFLSLLLRNPWAAVEAASAEPSLLAIPVAEPATETYIQLGAGDLDSEILLELARGLCWAAQHGDALAGLHCLAGRMGGLEPAAEAAASSPSLLLLCLNQEVPEAANAVQASSAASSSPPPSVASRFSAWEKVYEELKTGGLSLLHLERLDDLPASAAGDGFMENLTLLQEVLGGWRAAAEAVLQDPFLTARLALPVLVKEQCLRTKARGATREQLIALVRKAKKHGY